MMMRKVNHVGMSYCWMSCLQYLQLTGAHKGVGINVSKLFVATQRPKREERERDKLNMRALFYGKSSVWNLCLCVSACDSQSVHLCTVEGVTCHLLDAISGEPSVIGK